MAAACKRAGVPHWSPNQLRHSAATKIYDRFGLDQAQAVLGHDDPKTTLMYVARDLKKAAEVAAKITTDSPAARAELSRRAEEILSTALQQARNAERALVAALEEEAVELVDRVGERGQAEVERAEPDADQVMTVL